jgi:hypothetical protein
VKPEDPCWELGEFDLIFAWLCRQYEDLPIVLQTCADLSCMYSTRALFHLMEANDPLYEKLYDKSYKFPSVDLLTRSPLVFKCFARSIFMNIGIKVEGRMSF